MRALFTASLLWLGATAGGTEAVAQAVPTASGPGSYLALGAGFSGFNTDYGHNRITGGVAYVDFNPQWRVGLEGEARWLRWHADEQVTESDYLGGVRVSLWKPHRLQPYAKFLAGAGEITLPFGYAHGGFLTYAPGGGLDIALNDRVSVRAVDVEYQRWPKFTYGALNPYGVSAGISMRFNGVSRYVKGARASR